MPTVTPRIYMRRPQATLPPGQGAGWSDYYDYINGLHLKGLSSYWILDEASAAGGALDYEGSVTGTYAGTGVTYGVLGPCDAQKAVTLNGTSGKITFGDVYDFNGTVVFAVEAWVKLAVVDATNRRIVSKEITDGSGTQGWYLAIQASTGKPLFGRRLNGASDDCVSARALTVDGLYHHILAIYDGTNMTIYVDGVLQGTLASSKSVINHTGVFTIGARSDSTFFFSGSIAHVAVYSGTVTSITSLGTTHWYMGWTDVTTDVLQDAHIVLKRGIQGHGPSDCVAGSGECRFSLQNDSNCLGGVAGYYSPGHASMWTGWGLGTHVRVVFNDGTDHIVGYFRIESIDPDPGVHSQQLCHVVGYDIMRGIHESEVREVAVQLNQTLAGVLSAIINGIPAASRPRNVSIGGAADTYPYSLDNVGSGTKAGSLIWDIVMSAQARAYATAAGTFTNKERSTIQTQSSTFTFTNTMRFGGLHVETGDDIVFNRTRVTVHPRSIDTANVVLWAATSAMQIATGDLLEMWVTFRSPSDVTRLIGATGVINPVAVTDYTAFENADGTGADLTSAVLVTLTAYATTAFISIVNTGPPAFFVNASGQPAFQVRGKGIYDNGPLTFEKLTLWAYGDKPMALDLPYVADSSFGENVAQYVTDQYDHLAGQPRTLEFVATSTTALLTQALAGEITDKITITETQTGLASVTALINSIELDLGPGGQLICRYGLAPASPYENVWQLGVAGFGELGNVTTLGL
jgi:hypothetical protein